jgi:hypothetical protein
LETTNLCSATTRRSSAHLFTAIIYFAAFTTGAIVMSFEMLGSRYLNPFFGSGIYTWAALISTVLAALTAGYFIGASSPTAQCRLLSSGPSSLAPRFVCWHCRVLPKAF